MAERARSQDPGGPTGGVYEWYQRALSLIGRGSPAAALPLLQRVTNAEPSSHSAREALGRAQYDAGRYAEAEESFASIVGENPVDHYARYGLGLAATRNGDLDRAVKNLALAVSLRPEHRHYRSAYNAARATRAARR